jgi:hypothetical protein
MKLNIGDKVKFLNAKGGGVICRILDSRMVSVAVEGGFEIPTLISELIRLEEDEPAGRIFRQELQDYQDLQVEDKTIADDRMSVLPAALTRNRKSEEIFLVFVPHDQKWLISGLVDIMLINNSSYDILYNIYLQNPDGGFTGKDYGSCFPDSRLILDTITREQITEWTDGYLQFLFHNNARHDVLPPFNSQFKVSGQKFYNEASYRETPFISEKAILVKILSITDYFKISTASEDKVNTKRISAESDSLINKHKVDQREAEVDLHIHELMEDPGLIGNQEILDFQKDYFQKCLDSAITNHLMKVTFIHGIGNSVLREAILQILKNYDGLEVVDAPMQKYGVGAIEVRIPHNF